MFSRKKTELEYYLNISSLISKNELSFGLYSPLDPLFESSFELELNLLSLLLCKFICFYFPFFGIILSDLRAYHVVCEISALFTQLKCTCFCNYDMRELYKRKSQ